MTFKFAGARAQVCKYCKFLVARTDRGLAKVGQVADLVEIPSPLGLGVLGYWNGKRFEVGGRVQIDRVGAASAPWQEFSIVMADTGQTYWIAYAQGRWYWTQEVSPTPELPPLGRLRPAMPIMLPGAGQVTIAEVGRRKVVSEEGELSYVAAPGVATPYADFSGPNGVFGTIDYGDGQSIPPKLFVGRQFDPQTFKLDSGQPLDKPQAQVEACTCPSCGGSLPLVAPGTAERIVCKYCGTVSDIKQGGALLEALGQAPRPLVNPYVPLGAEGYLRDRRVICIGFVVRGTTVEGSRYNWREYLLYAGPSVGYLWLMEEDNKWQLVSPLPPGEVHVSGTVASYRGSQYVYKQSVQASVDYVVGEFYWKVEIGETVQATEYQGPGGIVSVEQDASEVNTSFCQPVDGREIAQAFRLAPPPSPAIFSGDGGSVAGKGCNTTVIWVIIVIVIILLVILSDCDGGSGGGGTGVYVGPGFSGGK
jgi:hypothetical protein